MSIAITNTNVKRILHQRNIAMYQPNINSTLQTQNKGIYLLV